MLASLFASGELYVARADMMFRFRLMQRDDIPRVTVLEHQLFRSAWSAEMFTEDLGQDYALSLVLLDGDLLIAYVVMYLIVDEIHIANLGVAPEYQRLGIGYTLLYNVLQVARSSGFAFAHLEVRQSNLAAIALYQKLGFERVGMRKNYYEMEHEDAILMSCLLQVNPKLQTPE